MYVASNIYSVSNKKISTKSETEGGLGMWRNRVHVALSKYNCGNDAGILEIYRKIKKHIKS